MKYHYQPPVIYQKFNGTEWFGNTLGYGLDRYSAIEKRMTESFRYVACESRNIKTYSYEFSSIIRDVGSVFGSIMDTLVREDDAFVSLLAKDDRLNITHYRKWLVQNVPRIHLASIEINILLYNRFIMPFSMLKDESSRIYWWDDYNNLKHSDIDHYTDGNLGAAIFGMSALAGLLSMMHEGNILFQITLFRDFGYREPIEDLEKRLFTYQKQQ
jgi:hypothetical protein